MQQLNTAKGSFLFIWHFFTVCSCCIHFLAEWNLERASLTVITTGKRNRRGNVHFHHFYMWIHNKAIHNGIPAITFFFKVIHPSCGDVVV